MSIKVMQDAKTMTEKRKKFVIGVASGMSPTHAARAAGFKAYKDDAYQLMRSPLILRELEIERARYEKAADMSRKKVMDGILEAIDIAKQMSEPSSMISGWREIARICGYYAPETKKLDVTINGQMHISKLEELSDDELLAKIIEGEATQIDDSGPVLIGHDTGGDVPDSSDGEEQDQ